MGDTISCSVCASGAVVDMRAEGVIGDAADEPTWLRVVAFGAMVNAKAEPTERAATAIVVNFMMCLLVQDQSELRKYDTEFGCVETRILEF